MVKAVHCPSCGGRLNPDLRACPQCGTTVATRRCGICFDLNLIGDRNCRRCGEYLPDENSGSRSEPLSCPGCGAPMTSRILEGTTFDECDHCGGLWLHPTSMKKVTTDGNARARLRPHDLPKMTRSGRAQPAVTYRKCPIGHKLMNRSNFARGAGVIVDVCREHGSYFDRGELTHIFHFIEGGGLEKARRRGEEARRSAERDERRKAILVGASDFETGPTFDPWAGSSGLDILRWFSELL